MDKKILITYATKTESTSEAAGFIGKELAEFGAEVDVRPVTDVDDINSYDAAIVGSPNFYGKPLPAAKKFLKRHEEYLSQIPVAYFFTTMWVTTITDEAVPEFPVYVDVAYDKYRKPKNNMGMMEKAHASSFYLKALSKIAPGIKPVGVGFFKGRLDFARLSFFDRMVMKFMKWRTEAVREGEYLNPEIIRQWSKKLSSALFNGSKLKTTE